MTYTSALMLETGSFAIIGVPLLAVGIIVMAFNLVVAAIAYSSGFYTYIISEISSDLRQKKSSIQMESLSMPHHIEKVDPAIAFDVQVCVNILTSLRFMRMILISWCITSLLWQLEQ